MFPLVKWNALGLPVNLDFVPPDTCIRQVTTGSLTLDSARHTFNLAYRIVSCRGFDAGSISETGTYEQNDTTLEFHELSASGAPVPPFTGDVLADRIVVNDGDTLEFLMT